MSNLSTLEFKLITDKNELINYNEQITHLFSCCFNKNLSKTLWEWFYILNPIGNPIVALALDREKVIAHYAVIPTPLKYKNTKLKAFLSMTTMVDPLYQGKGLFVKLADIVYENLQQIACDLVMGFPNKNSINGFTKYLGWQINTPSEIIISATKSQLANCKKLIDLLHQNSLIEIDKSNEKFLEWRLSKPGTTYQRYGKNIVKRFNNSFDIVYMDKDFINELPDSFHYNLLIDNSIIELEKYKVFDYPYGFRIWADIANVKFKKDLLLSDIF